MGCWQWGEGETGAHEGRPHGGGGERRGMGFRVREGNGRGARERRGLGVEGVLMGGDGSKGGRGDGFRPSPE